MNGLKPRAVLVPASGRLRFRLGSYVVQLRSRLCEISSKRTFARFRAVVKGRPKVRSLIYNIDCLGRLPSTYNHFIYYCRSQRPNYTFNYVFLTFAGEALSGGRIQPAQLATQRIHGQTILRVHCELQLLRYFEKHREEMSGNY